MADYTIGVTKLIPQKISILIPAHNEEKYIYQTVQALKSIGEVGELIVIDDASNDKTAILARQAGAMVISLPRNLGKGGALNAGFAQATGDVIALVDGDLGSSAVEIAKLLAPVLAGHADMTVAKFPKARKKGGFGLVKGLARNGIKWYTGLETLAPLSGQRVMTRQVADFLGGFESGYGVEVGMTIDVARKGFRITEVEANMTHAETGRDLHGFLHRGRQFIDVARVLASRLVVR
ncbi:MAG: glycosyltransferase family 2 protein [Thermincola sp.]|jgi:glycosyltransferase involved in cell wall biosynthesis|nr:glycosyltransferase family 2 protein [Thermincola sp.]MDT3703674.1 glycosyltransferase family 2 protein [Thermincola sp.]